MFDVLAVLVAVGIPALGVLLLYLAIDAYLGAESGRHADR